jgi:hypothetical protein
MRLEKVLSMCLIGLPHITSLSTQTELKKNVLEAYIQIHLVNFIFVPISLSAISPAIRVYGYRAKIHLYLKK